MGAWLERNGWLIAIAVAYLYIFPHFPKVRNANEMPRVYLVKAMADDGTFAIDGGIERWGRTADVATTGGHSYSNKAPGSSMMVVPFYAAFAVFGEPSLDFTVWLCRVISGVIPTLLFLGLLWGFLERFTPDPAVRRVVLVAYALGSMAMTFSVLYISHQLSAVCVGSAWIFGLDFADGKRGRRALIAAGLLAGCAPLVDYQAAFALPILAGHLGWKLRARGKLELARIASVVIASALPPIALLLAYHHYAFGSALCTGYDPKCVDTVFANLQSQGFLGLSTFRWKSFVGSTIAPDNGLFTLAPWLLLAFPGGYLMWKRDRALTITCGLIAVFFIVFVSSLAMWRAGWSVGPRYITVMLPFLLPFVAVALDRARARWWLYGLACGAILVGVVVYTVSSATFPPWPDEFGFKNTVVHVNNPLYEVSFAALGEGLAAPNLLGAAIGSRWIGIIPYLIFVLAFAGWMIARASSVRVLAVAVVSAAIALALYRLFPATPHADVLLGKIVHFMT